MLYYTSMKDTEVHARIELQHNEGIDCEGELRSIHVVPETASRVGVWRTNTVLAENILDFGEALLRILEDFEYHARRYLIPSTGDSHLELCALFVQRWAQTPRRFGRR